MKDQLFAASKDYGISALGITRHESNTAIVCLFAYPSVPNENANLSLYTYGVDYHTVIGDILCAFGERFFPHDFSVHVDIGEPIDRKLAYNAGLGFYGKNGMLIHPQLGSFFFIGWIETSVFIPEDTPLSAKCLGCNACFHACPGNALSDAGLDTSKCSSAISQKKGKLSKEEEAILMKSGLCFGCDACQLVCPHNQHIETTYLPQFSENCISHLSLAEIMPLSNREFKEKYKDRAFSWRGKSVVLRNLEIISKETQE